MRWTRDDFAHQVHSIYLVEGPDAVYVGCTCKPIHIRWSVHKSDGRRGAGFSLHRAMHEHGESAFRVTVIAQSRDFFDGRATETAIIARLLREGVTLYNHVALDERYPSGVRLLRARGSAVNTRHVQRLTPSRARDNAARTHSAARPAATVRKAR